MKRFIRRADLGKINEDIIFWQGILEDYQTKIDDAIKTKSKTNLDEYAAMTTLATTKIAELKEKLK